MFHMLEQLFSSLRKANPTEWTAEDHCHACGPEAFPETQVLLCHGEKPLAHTCPPVRMSLEQRIPASLEGMRF